MRYQLQGERRFLCESVEFTVDGPVGQTDSVSEFFEVAPVHGMGVGHAHPFFEKALFQREDVRLVQMQACIDEVVGWSETVVSISTVDEGEVFQVGIIIPSIIALV